MVNPDPAYQHILVFGASLLEEGIASLLSRGINLKVSRVKYTDETAFLGEVVQKQPDVVLLNDSASLDKMHAFKILFSMPSLTGLRIIVTSLDNNIIDVYMKPDQGITRTVYEPERITITTTADLMEITQR